MNAKTTFPFLSTEIPVSHLDLVNGPRVAALTTLMPDGRPQTTVVWCNWDGRHLLLTTIRGFRKEKNLRADPRVTLLCYDPRRPLRYLEVRGRVVEMTEQGAEAHLDYLSKLYTGAAPYYGKCVPAELKAVETPVKCSILPEHVVALDAGGGKAEEVEPVWMTRSVVVPKPGKAVSGGFQALPESHLDLIVRPVHGVLTTLMADGQPQSSLVWADYDGECACVNTSLERQKGKNLQADPRLSLLVVDPEDTSRFLQIRGEAELVQDGALEHLDLITRQYTRHPQYYGYVFPDEKRNSETRVIVRIRARRVTVDAVHR